MSGNEREKGREGGTAGATRPFGPEEYQPVGTEESGATAAPASPPGKGEDGGSGEGAREDQTGGEEQRPEEAGSAPGEALEEETGSGGDETTKDASDAEDEDAEVASSQRQDDPAEDGAAGGEEAPPDDQQVGEELKEEEADPEPPLTSAEEAPGGGGGEFQEYVYTVKPAPPVAPSSRSLSAYQSVGSSSWEPTAHPAFLFQVVIDGQAWGEFTRVTHTGRKLAVFRYDELGRNAAPHMLIGGAGTYGALHLSWGVMDRLYLWEWLQAVDVGRFFRRGGEILMLDRALEVIRIISFERAWPYEWSGVSLDANRSMVPVETLTLACDAINVKVP